MGEVILNFDEYPSLALLPITAHDLWELIRVHPERSSHPLSGIVWEYNSIHDVTNGSLTVEVLLRFSRINSPVWISIAARRLCTEDYPVAFFILSVTEQTVPPSSSNSGHQISGTIPAFDALLGDATCIYNAKSPYLRCVVNPYGPCDGCPDYAS